MKPTLRAVRGVFELLRQRCRAVGQPGLTVYADAGELAAESVGVGIRNKAHANECSEKSLAAELQEMLADGTIDRDELGRLRTLPEKLNRCAERSHDITEAAT